MVAGTCRTYSSATGSGSTWDTTPGRQQGAMRVRPYLPVSAVGHRHEGAIARGAMYTAFSIVLFEFTLVIQYAIIRT